ncbi:hypothetical protein TWF106_004487 [Orbilia oligospora]|uniref:Septin-type G domain-containing protein n=1 Tax=Orbilia oligospora TaxID=2813651 RepID=A0A7C8Q5U3_ORBOL|nr:hypothetical protein TWF106_004487 [Orbilia oligospora]
MSSSKKNLGESTVLPKRYILVAGETGAGKSTFIANSMSSTGSINAPEKGHGLKSKASKIQEFTLGSPVDGFEVVLVDTPGFNDTEHGNTLAFSQITEWLEQFHRAGNLLSGAIYMHRITDNRMAGPAVHAIGIVEAICGARFAPNIMLLSNMWNTSQEGVYLKWEAELERDETFWAPLIRNGAKMDRYHYFDSSSFESNVQAGTAAREIISKMLRNNLEITQLVHEVVIEGKTITETGANGAVVRYLFDSGVVEGRKEKDANRNAKRYKDNPRLNAFFREEARQARANRERIQREWSMLDTFIGGVGAGLVMLAGAYVYTFVDGPVLDLALGGLETTIGAAEAFAVVISRLAALN